MGSSQGSLLGAGELEVSPLLAGGLHLIDTWVELEVGGEAEANIWRGGARNEGVVPSRQKIVKIWDDLVDGRRYSTSRMKLHRIIEDNHNIRPHRPWLLFFVPANIYPSDSNFSQRDGCTSTWSTSRRVSCQRQMMSSSSRALQGDWSDFPPASTIRRNPSLLLLPLLLGGTTDMFWREVPTALSHSFFSARAPFSPPTATLACLSFFRLIPRWG